jgi:succinate-acetate transporter protein
LQTSAPAPAGAPAPVPAPAPAPIFAEPTPLGLLGLAIGCASLLPLAFGHKAALTPDALRTTAWFCLLFGGGCQLIAGLMGLANKNLLGGTLLTTFSFNWVINAWALEGLSQGKVPSAAVVLAVDSCFLLIFVVMTYAFGFFSRLLFVFLLDIDALYALRIVKELTHQQGLATPIALCTVLLMLLALYIALALVLANATGRMMLPLGGPIFRASGPAPAPH